MNPRSLLKRLSAGAAVGCLLASPSWAKIDLVTLPDRDAAQLTIYNAADLTLVRETRTLTLKKGENRLEFGWANTLIDPTSVQLRAPQHEGKVRLLEVAYPPNVQGSAVWTIDSAVEGAVPVEITFFTSGLSWRSFYMGTLSEDESRMRLEGYVRVKNQSGEDYANAETRVIVGTIHTVDEIAELARRQAPYGIPGQGYLPMTSAPAEARQGAYRDMARVAAQLNKEGVGGSKPKQIIKEGLSEYFLYTIEGTESIENGWAKRLPSFETCDIPVRNLYRYEEERWGTSAWRFLFFKNDKEHKLGATPLPDGRVKIYRELADTHLSYTGGLAAKYIPVGQEAELDLGAAPDVKVEALLVNEKTENYLFGDNGHVAGFDRVLSFEIKIENNRALPAAIEIMRNMPHPFWEIENAPKTPAAYKYEKVDVDTVKYALAAKPGDKQTIAYTLRLFEGARRDKK